MKFITNLLIIFITVIGFYCAIRYYESMFPKIQKDIFNNGSYYAIDTTCKLNSTDIEREKLLRLTFLERSSMSLQKQENWKNLSHLQQEEWNNLFSLNMMDEVQQISCKEPYGMFNQSIFEEMKLFFIDVSNSGPILQKNITCFDKLKLNNKKLQCEYMYIERRKGASDGTINFLNPIKISNDDVEISLQENYNAIGITCTSPPRSLNHLIENRMRKDLSNNEPNYVIFYRDVFMYIPKVNVSQDTDDSKPDYSVIIFTIDSTSRSTFQRNLPLTTNYLTEGGAVLLQNHHRLGDNSYPNVIPTLAGRKMEKIQDGPGLMDTGMMEDVIAQHNMTWGWNLWEEKSYPTMYHEDMPGCGAFNLHGRTGWNGQPTTIYHRAAYIAMGEWGLRNQDLHGSCPSYLCINNSPLHKRQLDVLKMLVKTYCNTPYFAFLHISEYSHDRLNVISNMDNDFSSMLQQLDSLGCLNKTLLVVMGDHGRRGGSFSETRSGWLDSNTPLLFIRLPEQLKQEYPNIQDNLINNQNKMTTMLDIHKTFTDPIITNKEPQTTAGLSLLHPLPDRTCEEALVPATFCTCQPDRKELDRENSELIRPSQEITTYINTIANHSDCAKLVFFSIDWAFKDKEAYHIQLWLNAELDSNAGDLNTISAVFHGVFSIESLSVESVRRTDLYQPTSWCITDDSLDYMRPFCICNK